MSKPAGSSRSRSSTGSSFPHIDEAFKVNELDDPCICQVYGTGRAAGIGYIAMGVVDGHPLPILMELHHERANPEFWRSMFEHLAESLAKAHEAGLYHGSLRLSSVMLRSSGMPMILDFGLRGDAVSDDHLRELDVRCFVRLMRKCFACCEKRMLPEWLNALLQRLQSPEPGDEISTMQELAAQLSGAPVEEEEESIDVGAWVRAHKKGLRLSAWISLAAGLIVLLMGVGTGGMFRGDASSLSSRRAAQQKPLDTVLTEADIEEAEQAFERAKKAWKHEPQECAHARPDQ